MTGCHIKRVGFFCKQSNRFIFRYLVIRKALKGLLQNNDKCDPLITTAVDGSIFLKIFKTII